MRTVVAIATVLVASLAFADTDLTVKPNRIEMSVAAPAEDVDAAPSTSSVAPAADYNSSRSNKTRQRDHDDLTLRKRPGRAAASPESTPTIRKAPSAAAARDYNSSRSNNSSAHLDDNDDDSDGDVIYDRCERASTDGVDDDCDGVRGAAAPANHNTSRSNRTID